MIDRVIFKIKSKNYNLDSKKDKSKIMLIAVTLHNVPEGMAVGVALAGVYFENIGITMASSIALSLGIAIQNIPEGAIISMPLLGKGYSKLKAFGVGVLSGVVEPIAAIITILLVNVLGPIYLTC